MKSLNQKPKTMTEALKILEDDVIIHLWFTSPVAAQLHSSFMLFLTALKLWSFIFLLPSLSWLWTLLTSLLKHFLFSFPHKARLSLTSLVFISFKSDETLLSLLSRLFIFALNGIDENVTCPEQLPGRRSLNSEANTNASAVSGVSSVMSGVSSVMSGASSVMSGVSSVHSDHWRRHGDVWLKMRAVTHLLKRSIEKTSVLCEKLRPYSTTLGGATTPGRRWGKNK